MKRDELIKQVKEKYASIASAESQQHFHDTTNEITSEAYYEKLLQSVINEILNGTFDIRILKRTSASIRAKEKRF